jgi:hypothetical protein
VRYPSAEEERAVHAVWGASLEDAIFIAEYERTEGIAVCLRTRLYISLFCCLKGDCQCQLSLVWSERELL